jgi:tyrosyl-tRNA synthetase
MQQKFKSAFLNELSLRGFIHQISDEDALDNFATQETITGYIGFDATARSLHVGSLLPIMMLFWMQQRGHRPIVLMGGGTTRVGDPSGKDESRKILSEREIRDNLRHISSTFSGFLKFDHVHSEFFQPPPPSNRIPAWATSNFPPSRPLKGAIMVDNAEWLDRIKYIDFLRDIGRYFSVNRMLSFDSAKNRIDREQELSFLEFNYMILQAYDFVELNRRFNCTLQMGGSDQWGNICNGIDLSRRLGGKRLFGLTAELITTASGAKMGKTASGAVWLDPALTSPYEFWQYWRNTDDRDVKRFLKLFTRLPLNRIEELTASKRSINDAKHQLANHVTELVHGETAAASAATTARITFESGGMGDDLPTLMVNVGDGILTANNQIGFATSNSQARQFVKDGAVYLGDRKITDPNYKLRSDDFDNSGRVLLRLSKKRGILVRK